jgi:hypothetical protein
VLGLEDCVLGLGARAGRWWPSRGGTLVWGWGGTLVMFIARYLVGVRKRRKTRPRWDGLGRHFGHVYSKVSSWSPKEKEN